MPFNGTGQFSLVYSWANDAANGIDITASRFDTQEGDMATSGFDNCLTRDGQGIATANLPMGGFKHTGVANGTANTDYAAYGQLLSTVGALQGFIGGLTLSTAGSSSTFSIAAGAATDSTNALLMPLSAFTKTTGSFTAGSGNGALDAGSIANSTWYHVFLIGAPATAPDILISLSPTSPTLPGAYTLFRRIGSMITDASAHWTNFAQRGNQFLWKVPVSDANGVTSGATTAITKTLTVPTGIQVDAMFNWAVGATTSNSGTNLVTSLDQTDTAVSNTAYTLIVPAATAPGSSFGSAPLSIRTNTSAQIRVRFAAADATYYIATMGWIDSRGQG
jgi:hypothetical protein